MACFTDLSTIVFKLDASTLVSLSTIMFVLFYSLFFSSFSTYALVAFSAIFYVSLLVGIIKQICQTRAYLVAISNDDMYCYTIFLDSDMFHCIPLICPCRILSFFVTAICIHINNKCEQFLFIFFLFSLTTHIAIFLIII